MNTQCSLFPVPDCDVTVETLPISTCVVKAIVLDLATTSDKWHAFCVVGMLMVFCDLQWEAAKRWVRKMVDEQDGAVHAPLPIKQFIQGCRKRLFRLKVADSTGLQLTGGRLLAAALVLRRLLIRKGIATSKRPMVGVWLPPSVGAVLANAGIGLSGNVAVNLNYSFANENVLKCIQQCRIAHVVTSRKFLQRRPLEVDAEFVYLEDLVGDATWFDRIVAGFAAYLIPSFLVEQMLGLNNRHVDDLMAVLFTSGTTGEPKGVMLSHGNIASSIDAIRKLFKVESDDVVLGILPFFHAFGYSATLWLGMALDMAVVYHFDPFGTSTIGELAKKYRVTVLFATPSFLRLYWRRCRSEDFADLDLAIVGAERLEPALATKFSEKFGATPVEGYGATELAPWATVNVPSHRSVAQGTNRNKLGTVGLPVPGVQLKVIDPESRLELGIGQDGLLLVRGPNVMLGYLNLPEKTASVIQDGWYDTGDIARLDADGFVTISGRQSRFSKIGGETVPHEIIEQLIAKIICRNEEESVAPNVAVTAIPDAKKGERLIVVHTPLSELNPNDINSSLATMAVPNLWIPRPKDFVEVQKIPLTSIGKLDLAALKRIALAHTVDSAMETAG
ncbi:MAG: AMP-binding protein [Pirellula sp.]